MPKQPTVQMNMEAPFICPECKEEFPSYQARYQHRRFKHGIKPVNPNQNQHKRPYHRKNQLVKINRKSHLEAKSHATVRSQARNRAEVYLTEDDLRFEGTAAFTAGQIYETVRSRAEAAGLPYQTLADRVYEFVRTTANGKVVGHSNRMSVLPSKATA